MEQKYLEERIKKNYNNIAGMVVQKDGKIVYENYFNDYTNVHVVQDGNVNAWICGASAMRIFMKRLRTLSSTSNR